MYLVEIGGMLAGPCPQIPPLWSQGYGVIGVSQAVICT